MERVLVVNVNWLGDVLLSTPTIRAIRENFPNTYIGCMVTPSVKEILENNSDLDEIIIFDEEKEHKGIFGKIRFIQQLKKKKFSKVFLLHRSFTRTFLCYLAGIKERIGYYTRKRGFLLTKKVSQPKKDSMHRADFYSSILKAEGIKVRERDYVFIIRDKDREYINDLLREEGLKEEPLIVINPGGNWKPKRWPKEYFAELSDRLIEEFKVKVAITGSKGNRDLEEEIKNLMREKPICLCGKTSLKQLGALFERASVVITADTSAMHVASAVRVNLVCLFGPTSPFITGPIGRGNCRILQKDVGCKIPCYEVDCKDNRCMKEITVDEVLREIRSLYEDRED